MGYRAGSFWDTVDVYQVSLSGFRRQVEDAWVGLELRKGVALCVADFLAPAHLSQQIPWDQGKGFRPFHWTVIDTIFHGPGGDTCDFSGCVSERCLHLQPPHSAQTLRGHGYRDSTAMGAPRQQFSATHNLLGYLTSSLPACRRYMLIVKLVSHEPKHP